MIYAIDGQAIVKCHVEDISVSGARISLDKETELPGHFVLVMSHAGQVRRQCTLVWQFSIVAGARFKQ